MDIEDPENDPVIDLGGEASEAIIAASKPEPKAKKGMGFVPVLLMSLLAAGGGAIGGAFLSQGVDVDVPAETVSFAEIDTLKSQISKLEQAQKIPNQTVAEVDLSPIEARLVELESRPHVTEAGTVIDPGLVARIDALEVIQPQNTPVDFSPIEERLTSLEAANKSEPSSGNISEEINARLEALELALGNAEIGDSLLDMESRLAKLEETPELEPVDLTDVEIRIAALEEAPQLVPADLTSVESRLTELESALSTVRAAFSVPAFPGDAVLSALAEAGQAEEKGWFGRTLSKHVKVADETSAAAVAAIEKSIENGDIDTALAQAKKLPENGRAAAQDWINAVSAQRKLP